MRKRDIKKYYKLEPQMGLNGKVKEVPVYIGKYYEYTDPVFTSENAFKRIGAASLLTLLLLVAAMIPDTYALRQIYIALPYVITLLPTMMLVFAAWGLKSAGGRLTEPGYQDTVVRGQGCATVLCVLTVYCAIADSVLVFVHFEQIILLKELFFIIINIISLLLSFIQLKYIKTLNKTLTKCE